MSGLKTVLRPQRPFAIYSKRHCSRCPLFRIDKPLYSKKTNRLFENFTRVETFGDPDTHWVRVTVDAKDPQLFRFDQQIVFDNVVNRRAK